MKEVLEILNKIIEMQEANYGYGMQTHIKLHTLCKEAKEIVENFALSGVGQQRKLLIADMFKMIKSYTDEEVNLVCKQRNEMYGSNLQWPTYCNMKSNGILN